MTAFGILTYVEAVEQAGRSEAAGIDIAVQMRSCWTGSQLNSGRYALPVLCLDLRNGGAAGGGYSRHQMKCSNVTHVKVK